MTFGSIQSWLDATQLAKPCENCCLSFSSNGRFEACDLRLWNLSHVPRCKSHKSNPEFYWLFVWFHLNNQGRPPGEGARYRNFVLCWAEMWKREWMEAPFDLKRTSWLSHIENFFKKPVERCSVSPPACLTGRSPGSSRTFLFLRSFPSATLSEAEFCVVLCLRTSEPTCSTASASTLESRNCKLDWF